MLAHTSTEVYSCLTDVFGIYTAAACLKVDTFLVEFARTGFVGAAEDVAQFWTRFGVEIDVIVKECSLELTV